MKAMFFVMAICLLPAIILFIWFTRKKSDAFITPVWFLLCLALGMISALLGIAVNGLLPSSNNMAGILGKYSGLWDIFIHIALSEELVRFIALLIFFIIAERISKLRAIKLNDASFFYSASGITAGLGFAAVETLFFVMNNLDIAILRAVTAAPLHAACAAKIGVSVWNFRKKNIAAALRQFLYAFALHGIYDYLIPRGGLLTALACACAALNCASSIAIIERENAAITLKLES